MQPTIYVQFVTTSPGRDHRGFRLRYEIISEALIKEPPSYVPDDEKMFERECGGATKPGQLTGEIVSPGYPDTYPRNVTCYWLIRVDPRQRVYIRLAHLHLSSTIAECERASLSIIDGYKHAGEVFKKDLVADASETRFCGSQLYYMEEGMKSYLSSANRLLVRLNTKDRPSTSTAGQIIGFKLIWTAVESLFDENPLSLSSSDRRKEPVQFNSCSEFTCQGGQICVEQDQGVCAMRPQLCIHSSLVCNGVQNCVEGYSREIIAGSVGGFLGITIVVCICVCCDQWRKRRRVRKMLRERREVANGKTQRAYRHDVHLNHDISFDRTNHVPRFSRDDDALYPMRYNRSLPPSSNPPR
ncbi:CUB domain protein [Necator americanus]|uniref:CUB domain protein n=1 Tax=Necator americanus TaxID=51031 RepID=W2TWZ9_NECAM|nr:CUB domain protein [Necator americanus]ETN86204.1 CUB domain protein [Necator americanus]